MIKFGLASLFLLVKFSIYVLCFIFSGDLFFISPSQDSGAVVNLWL